jgi:hypothetical protein
MADANPMQRPTLLSSCARAATAAEAAFRVQYPNSLPRASAIIALDAGAAEIMAGVSEEPWAGAQFLTVAPRQPDISPNEVTLLTRGGDATLYTAELAKADMVVMLATTSIGEGAAGIIGRLAREASVMTAGIVMSSDDTDGVIAALRPSAAVLVSASSPDYLGAMLTALRA